MKPYNVRWLRSQTAKEKNTKYAQTQNGDSIQSIFVLYMSQLEDSSQHKHVQWEGVGVPTSPAPLVYAEVLATQHAAL